LPRTHTDSHRQRLFFSPVDLTGEKPSACGAAFICHPGQPIHHSLSHRPDSLIQGRIRCAQRAKLLSGQVARAKKSLPVCVGLWLNLFISVNIRRFVE
jgi:hypothetical protein